MHIFEKLTVGFSVTLIILKDVIKFIKLFIFVIYAGTEFIF